MNAIQILRMIVEHPIARDPYIAGACDSIAAARELDQMERGFQSLIDIGRQVLDAHDKSKSTSLDTPVRTAIDELVEWVRATERSLSHTSRIEMDARLERLRVELARIDADAAAKKSKRTSMVARKTAVGWCEDDDAAVDEMVASGQSRRDAVESVLQTLEHDKRCEDESR